MWSLHGLPAAPGLASAAAVVLDAPPAGAQVDVSVADRPTTAALAIGALHAAADELEALARTLAGEDAQIVEAGAMMARDPELEAAVRRAVIENGRPAAAAIVSATDAMAAVLASLPDELLAARAADVRSVGRRAARLAHGGQDARGITNG